MNGRTEHRFEFPSTPGVEGVDPGTNVLVSGPSGSGAREVALQLVTDLTGDDEACLLVSADVGGRALLARTDRVAPELDRSRLAIVDCSGLGGADEQQRFEPAAVDIESPAALPEVSVELSRLYETLVERGTDCVRIGVFSLSAMLAHAGLRPVARFVHMLTGRVIATGDLGVFVLDESAVDERAVDALGQFCDGHVTVRDDGENASLRVDGLEDGSATWEYVGTVDVE